MSPNKELLLNFCEVQWDSVKSSDDSWAFITVFLETLESQPPKSTARLIRLPVFLLQSGDICAVRPGSEVRSFVVHERGTLH